MKKETKKAPTIRFRGFTDDWEQRKLGDICSEIGDGLHSAPTYDKKGTYYFINGNNLVDGKIVIDSGNTPRVSDNVFAQNDNHLNNRTILMSINGTIGNLAYYKNESVILGKSVAFLKCSDIDKKFLFCTLQIPYILNQFRLSLTGTTIKNLGIRSIKNTILFLPNNTEQEQIGTFFSNLDNTITLHQRKLNQLKKLKKYFLQNMFPAKGEKVPRIRFKGFTGDWEQRKLGDVFTSLQNNTLSRADLSDEGGLALDIHYGDILIKYGEFLDVSKERIPYLTNKKTIDKFKKSHLQNGDIVVSDTAEDETVGKCTEINGVTTQIVLSGLHTIPLRPVQRFAKGYFGSYLNSEAYHAQLKPLMQGIKVTSISKRAIQDTTVIYPLDLMEQEKIGQYFLSLDHLITLHQRKLDQLQMMKKFMLQNLFI